MSEHAPFSRHAGNAWKRWEMASFDTPPAKPVAAPAPPDPDLLRKEVQRLRDAAQTRGHAEGYAAGHTQGIQAGTEEGHKLGHQQGYDAGYAAGHAAGREESQREAARVRELAESFTDSLGAMEAEMGQAIIALSIRIAEQVLRSTLDTQPEKILSMIRDILEMNSAGKDGILTLRVHPDDLALVEEFLDGDIGAHHWRLLPDPSLDRGGCIAETALGTIDATLQTRWERVTSGLGHKTVLKKARA
jgi:flagellar assembly protein FliH